MRSVRRPRLVEAPNRFERNFAHLPEKERAEIVEVLRGFVRDLRLVLRDSVGPVGKQYPDRELPCETCAFNPRTDAERGFAPTAYNLLWAFEASRVFYCHRNQGRKYKEKNLIDPSLLTPCNGFVHVVTFDPARARRVASRAAHAIRKIALRTPRSGETARRRER